MLAMLCYYVMHNIHAFNLFCLDSYMIMIMRNKLKGLKWKRWGRNSVVEFARDRLLLVCTDSHHHWRNLPYSFMNKFLFLYQFKIKVNAIYQREHKKKCHQLTWVVLTFNLFFSFHLISFSLFWLNFIFLVGVQQRHFKLT